jgi:hypothetical protein
LRLLVLIRKREESIGLSGMEDPVQRLRGREIPGFPDAYKPESFLAILADFGIASN